MSIRKRHRRARRITLEPHKPWSPPPGSGVVVSVTVSPPGRVVGSFRSDEIVTAEKLRIMTKYCEPPFTISMRLDHV